MNILIAPDSWKESLPAADVAREIEAGFRTIFPDATFRRVPLADGGEGTVDAIVGATGGTIEKSEVTGPTGVPVQAYFGVTGDSRTGVIEMAAASGLVLVPPAERNPLATTSRGTGELILRGLDAGVEMILVGLGGSATNDGGAGMLQALGVRLLDRTGREIGSGGGAVAELEKADFSGIDPRLKMVPIIGACDVGNPLVGPNGASAVFGPQKGATPEMVATLDRNLARFADILRRDIGVEVATTPGAGTAGGMGAALLAMGGKLQPGVDIVMAAVGFEALVEVADLVITGEGRIDGQTAQGKAPLGVARVARRHGKPVVAIAGSLAADAESILSHGIDALFSAVRGPCSQQEALARAAENIRQTARHVAAAVKVGQSLRDGWKS